MELDTINKLYLELSQIATAKTQKDIHLINGLVDIRETSLALCHKIEAAGASEELTELSLLASHLYREIRKITDEAQLKA